MHLYYFVDDCSVVSVLFNIYFIWFVYVVDFNKVCDPGWVCSFHGMWSCLFMAVHFVDLYFYDCLGLSIVWIVVFNLGEVRPL